MTASTKFRHLPQSPRTFGVVWKKAFSARWSPPAERIYVGFMGVWNEDTGSSLDFLVKPSGYTAGDTIFTHARRVFTLEREQLQRHHCRG